MRLLDRLIYHCDIVEIGNDSWRFKAATAITQPALAPSRNPDQLRRRERYR